MGSRAIVDAWRQGGFGTSEFGEMRCIPTRANMQPAVACYLRRPGEPDYSPLALDVLAIEDGRVAEIVTFPGSLFAALKLPARRCDRRPPRAAGQAAAGAFDVRAVAIASGSARAYDAADWRDALVVVERGEIELECRGGNAWAVRAGGPAHAGRAAPGGRAQPRRRAALLAVVARR